MKSFGKVLSLILIMLLLAPTFASAGTNIQYADILYEIGLFRGTDNGYELEKTFTREEAATILVRLLGEEKYSENKSYKENFSDVISDRWSFPYVMYCYENEITKGTGENAFSPEMAIPADQFVALVLRLMGYTDAEPENAFKESIYLNMLNSEVVSTLETSSEFTRNDMVYIVYRSLMCKMADGTLLADYLAEKGVISEKEAEQFDVYKNFNDIDELLDNLIG